MKHKKQQNKQDRIYEFWKNYKSEDCIERRKIVDKLITNYKIIELIQDTHLDKDTKKLILVSLFQSYFDDVVVYIK